MVLFDFTFNDILIQYLIYIYTHVAIRPFRRLCDRMVVGFATTYAVSVCCHQNCEYESRS